MCRKLKIIYFVHCRYCKYKIDGPSHMDWRSLYVGSTGTLKPLSALLFFPFVPTPTSCEVSLHAHAMWSASRVGSLYTDIPGGTPPIFIRGCASRGFLTTVSFSDFCPNRGFSGTHPCNLDIQQCPPQRDGYIQCGWVRAGPIYTYVQCGRLVEWGLYMYMQCS